MQIYHMHKFLMFINSVLIEIQLNFQLSMFIEQFLKFISSVRVIIQLNL